MDQQNNTTGGGIMGGMMGGNNNNAAAGQQQKQQDVGDKIFSTLAAKSGHSVNPNTAEKITDGARGMFEKATG
ncbi:hypothetical protein QBC46DRAFT_59584 [Diplogelasinospora grovesii]|uniref:Uncharacterized protein n=1 Tax=Diplogelasinospora grovesii TaxID=303347 RepID=A0AAN6MWV6_9PEZI|nr:hypothetical protein QBC46DRAFT_59584 [Diplogelasinospora grovesii]